ncbi:hypothetical protein TruAng_012079 [Truncatella angustata]|nr:hypothetical protein TruAng_012079 [Truncatella angustata]
MPSSISPMSMALGLVVVGSLRQPRGDAGRGRVGPRRWRSNCFRPGKVPLGHWAPNPQRFGEDRDRLRRPCFSARA